MSGDDSLLKMYDGDQEFCRFCQSGIAFMEGVADDAFICDCCIVVGFEMIEKRQQEIAEALKGRE